MGWDGIVEKNFRPMGWDGFQNLSSHPIPWDVFRKIWSHGMGWDGMGWDGMGLSHPTRSPGNHPLLMSSEKKKCSSRKNECFLTFKLS